MIHGTKAEHSPNKVSIIQIRFAHFHMAEAHFVFAIEAGIAVKAERGGTHMATFLSTPGNMNIALAAWGGRTHATSISEQFAGSSGGLAFHFMIKERVICIRSAVFDVGPFPE